MNSGEQVWPQVVVDIGIGKHVDNFEVDLDAVAEHLRDRSMSNEDIAGLKVRFLDKQPKRTDHLDGRYKPLSNTIEVFTRRRFGTHDGLQESFRQIDRAGEYEDANLAISTRILEREFNETLYHELEHAIIRREGGMPEAKRHTKRGITKMSLKTLGIMAAAMGAVEVSSYVVDPATTTAIGGAAMVGMLMSANYINKKDAKKMYKTDPEEIRCFAAQRSEGLISLKYKSIQA